MLLKALCCLTVVFVVIGGIGIGLRNARGRR
jgi:hypothetical protein